MTSPPPGNARLSLAALLAACLLPAVPAWAAGGAEAPPDATIAHAPPAPERQTDAEVRAKGAGCQSCHTETDSANMHDDPAVHIGCADCHGGDPRVERPEGAAPGDAAYRAALDRAHVRPRFPDAWAYPSSANPRRTYTLLNRERPEFVRFVNPGDYRAADRACGACHAAIIEAARRSLMTTSTMLWGGAAYNNGILPFKNYNLGESYLEDGAPAVLKSPTPPGDAARARGVLPEVYPLPAWEVTPPGDIFRVFERGGRVAGTGFPETGLPNISGRIQTLNEPGRPDIHASSRGPGTAGRVALPVLNLTKTRLNDPHASFMGTNDQPGDYRQSGCSACHVVYSNDRDAGHSGPYARYGHDGTTQTVDPTIPRDAPGHPLWHRFTRAIPTSQCMSCHMHQPNVFLNTFLGYTMWDYESDAPAMWPETQRHPTDRERHEAQDRNPEGAVVRGRWADPEFLGRVADLNPTLHDTQFADYHGHGWNFRAVFKRDRHGHLLDADGKVVPDDDPDKFHRAVHLSSIHLDKGMHCVDCHFAQDNHGTGDLHGEVAAGVEIMCKDCHGTVDAYPTLRTSGPAAPPGGTDLSLLRNPDGRRRFEWIGDRLHQRSLLDPDQEWTVPLVKDVVDPNHPDYNARAARAMTMSRDPRTQAWGPGIPKAERAHDDDTMHCYTCHTSWTTSCGGCHLPMEANARTDRLHFEGGETRNYASYNPQVARDQMFQIGRRGPVKGGRIAPVRSSSALVLSSTNANREHIYVQQPPISSAGFSSQAFAPHFPHTVRATETKTCTDCHLSEQDDNNAIMAQLLLLGTNFVNFVGLNAWVGTEGAVEAVRVTEWDEPQAVIGSYLQRYAYPDDYRAHLARDRRLTEAHGHRSGPVGCLQLRGEYLYAAEGDRGMQVYDVAGIANKGVSQRIVAAPYSPLGYNTRIPSRDATCVALATNQPIQPSRNQGPLMREANREQPFLDIYRYVLVTDAREGLILTDNDTLMDGDPRNNFLRRALTWNPDGLLNGARHLTVGGYYVYIAADAGIVVADLEHPLAPRVAAVIPIPGARSTALQFRYLFVTDAAGLEVVDVTHPDRPRVVPSARVPLTDAHRVYVARTYAYVADGSQGLAIVDVERPEQPRLVDLFTADGALDDARDVVVASTNASLYAYVADGRNGLKVLSLTAPDRQPDFYGFSPEPRPELIATYKTGRPALALSKGLDRDRAVDETGGQIAVFGRLGSRPLNLEEMHRLYLDDDGQPYTVTDEVVPPKAAKVAATPPDVP